MELPVEELYLALSTGVVDGVAWGGFRDTYGLGIHDIAPYALQPPYNRGAMCNWLMNMDLWNSLPLDLQSILKVAGRDASKYQGLLYTIEDEMYYKKGNFIKTYLSDEDIATIKETAIGFYDDYAKTSPRVAKIVEIYHEYNGERGYWPPFDKEAFRASLPFDMGKYDDWPQPREGMEIWTCEAGGDVRPWKWED